MRSRIDGFCDDDGWDGDGFDAPTDMGGEDPGVWSDEVAVALERDDDGEEERSFAEREEGSW